MASLNKIIELNSFTLESVSICILVSLGLYNGDRGESHRARIPSKNNIRIYPPTDEASITDQVFGVNVGEGTKKSYNYISTTKMA